MRLRAGSPRAAAAAGYKLCCMLQEAVACRCAARPGNMLLCLFAVAGLQLQGYSAQGSTDEVHTHTEELSAHTNPARAGSCDAAG